jgi:acetylornithine deacetylase/succinyl-diaminopimelate desuccinylase-like protein
VNNGVVADLCVVAESTAGQISVESGGYVYLEVSTLGNPGATYFRRGAEAEVREHNAIERMNDVLAHLHEWGEKYVERSRGGTGVPTHFSLVSFEGGLAYRPSKEPALCRATVEVGVKPGQSLVDVVAEVTDCVRSSGVETAAVRLLQAVPGASVSPDEPVVTQLANAHMREFGQLPSLTSDGWLADTSHLTRYGIPSVCYSTAGRVREGGANYYPLGGEQCNLPDLARGARVFADLITSVGQQSREDLPDPRAAARGTVVL